MEFALLVQQFFAPNADQLLMTYAESRLRDHDDVTALAAQVASDAPALLAFYERNFRKQGSFPIPSRAPQS